METVDLTMSMDGDTTTYPGDPEATVEQHTTVDEDGYAVKRLCFPSHVSTHVDAPAHMIRGGRTVDSYPVERFVGEAIVLDVRGQDVIESVPNSVGDSEIVFFHTGHAEENYGDNVYYEDHPVVTEETAEELVDAGVKTVGLDSCSPDEAPFPVHEILLSNNVLIVENLVNLGAVEDERFRCYVMPLKVANSDGAPCRVVAEIE